MDCSEDEEETFYFGTPLEPYDDDAFPKKKPIAIEEQVAKDAQGRRRFHGAFTGGFSAGFFNTVGSLEGWTPAEFKSSRSDKAQRKLQTVEDFLDDEDVGQFGIAPQTVRATDNYSSNKKRKKQIFSDGPIPGEPVLESLIQAGNETIGYFLMKNMNKKRNKAVKDKIGPKVYGCMMPTNLSTEESFDKIEQRQLHGVYKQYLSKPKSNTFGLGYVGLNRDSGVVSAKTSKLTVQERNNKKLSISGQAFGVGAFEEDDDDIYGKEDMSNYDFVLTLENAGKKKTTSDKKETLILEMFVPSKTLTMLKDNFLPPVIPNSFTGKHNVKKSRFEPIVADKVPERRDMNVSIRAKYLDEDVKSDNVKVEDHGGAQVEDDKRVSVLNELMSDRFVSATHEEDITNLLEPVKPSVSTHGTKEMQDAVKFKMFGPLTRITISWQPNAMLCKRFNVPETHYKELNSQKNKRRTKNLIFEYQKHAENEPSSKSGLSETSIPIIEPATALNEPRNEVVQKQPTPENTQTEKEMPADVKETILDVTERVDVSKNTDLFKAVFLSSSESESEDEIIEEKETERKKELTANVLFEPLVPKIKSTKEGILSNIDFSMFKSTKTEDAEEKCVELDSGMYGPKLPTQVVVRDSVVVGEAIANNDEWIEKNLVEKRKHKKKHKQKKKHKHKF